MGSLVLSFAIVLAVVAVVPPVKTAEPDPLYESDVTLTGKEHEALKKFRPLIEAKLPTKSDFVNKYVKDDLYLVNWLRAKGLNLKAAEKMFEENVRWRIKEKMDTIDKEDWSQMVSDYPMYTNSTDKQGRPVSELWYSDWQVRNGVIGGQARRLSRWVDYLSEITMRRIFNARLQGKEVSRGILLLELENFSVIQQACPRCLPIILQMSTSLDAHYPRLWRNICLLHVPPSFDIILQLVRPALQEDTRRAIKSLPRNEDVRKYIESSIDKDQRSVRYKGTIVREGNDI